MRESNFIESVSSKMSLSDGHVETTITEKRNKYLARAFSCQKQAAKMLTRQMRSDFDPVFKLAAIFGLSFSHQSDFEENIITSNNMQKFYDCVLCFLALISLTITVTFSHSFTNSKVMMLTYCVKYIAGFLIRCYLIWDRNKTPQTIVFLSRLYNEISPEYKSLKLRIFTQCVCLTLLNFFLLTLTSLRVFYECGIHDYPYLSAFGSNITANGSVNFIHLMVASYMLNYFFSVFTMSVTILSCCNVHLIIRRLLKHYGNNLLQRARECLSKDCLREELVTFRKILHTIQEVDDAMSFLVFFTYVACISCFFNTLSGFLASSDLFEFPFLAAEMAVTFAFSIIIFSTMTCSAAEVSSAGESLKQRILCVSEMALEQDLPPDALLSFLVLMDNIKSSSMCLTGWGMFTITREFVLTTVGVMISYGVVLFQFG